MTTEINLSGPHKDFESIKKLDENGIEYWEARELMGLLGYSKWQNFEEVARKAINACVVSGQIVEDHFTDVSNMIEVGKGAQRNVKDYNLSRYACYLIAQNGDSNKPEIALAQTYFAIQTRRQELFDEMSADEKRLFIRGEVTDHNKKLFSTAHAAGVSNFGYFNNAGYKGLYGLSIADIEKRKKIKKGELLDRAGSTELAANLFRITQTDEKLKQDKIKGERLAAQTHNMIGGKVRQTIKDIGGVMPEDLPIERHIKELKKPVKRLPLPRIRQRKIKK